MKRVNVASLVIRAFDNLFNAVFSGTGEFWLKGGRGSTKSSFISICIVLLIVSFKDTNAVIYRRFGNTLRDSVYAQVGWAIGELGLWDYFRATTSPMEYTYKPTGQRIVFKGLDDPKKDKGVKFRIGYCAIVWFEELDQMRGWDDVMSVLKSLRRGGDRFWTFFSYNPPKTLWNWVNKKAIEMERKPVCVVNHSTYLDVVESGCADWLGYGFLAQAEYDKQTNEAHYRWEMLGEITGTGGSVFDNIDGRAVSDAEIRTFDNHRNGIDWGWFPDPWRFVRAEWQPGERRLIIFEEHSRNRTLPSDTARIVQTSLTWAENGADVFHNEPIWCDDTPDGKTHMGVYRRQFGLNARPAKKGNMRKLSYEWLAGLREIVIDPARCPLTYEEFTLCEYAKDKDGNWIDDFNDGNDHSIDAVRYAMMNEVIKGKAS